MLDERTVIVDRGAYPDAVTPWETESWRAAALDWVGGHLTERGLGVDGPLRVRLRPWSVLVRVPVTGQGAVWFKANPPGAAFEGPLTAALARWVPEHVLSPLAVDAGRGWSLLPDGGQLFRAVLDRELVEPREWESLLGQYAGMQRDLVARADEMERLGVPSARTADLPEVFDRLLDANTALGPDERARLKALRPRLVDWCAELAAAGIPDTLDHADLHDGQLLRPAPGRFTFFDWGDAAVTHPFCSLRVPAERARDRYGPGVLPRLLDAYLEPWTGGGRTPAGLRRAAGLAWRLSALGRAASWGRMFPAAPGTAPGARESAEWLRELLTEPPFPG
ncbi:phosphotransferase [Streptomyces rubradiris]|uniref:Phosphotransferase n=1 Tax=Streptomyces rubradiris TaxID=285531 RepID=A0ABQ3RBK3_STRRR|nr:phosphotransferase [Streptomyces rubradiris]GHH28063.1 phosphotransferase [Streptomyces rubradiris]GHI53240.1 phosphotransferase [Streptomyces rubradiris]